MSWWIMIRGSAQAGNRASRTGHHLQWREHEAEWRVEVAGATSSFFLLCARWQQLGYWVRSSGRHRLARRIGKKLFTLLDLCVSSLRRGHANLLCIVPILTDDPRRESKSCGRRDGCTRSGCEVGSSVTQKSHKRTACWEFGAQSSINGHI